MHSSGRVGAQSSIILSSAFAAQAARVGVARRVRAAEAVGVVRRSRRRRGPRGARPAVVQEPLGDHEEVGALVERLPVAARSLRRTLHLGREDISFLFGKYFPNSEILKNL